ncbi:MAG: TVP38/TMEM64 family protein [Solirubrobacterales bacterium]
MSDEPAGGDGGAPVERSPALRGVLLAAAGIALLAALVVAIGPLRSGVSDVVSGNTGGLRADLQELGVGGAAIVLLLGLVHVVVWYPAEILNAAVGYVYGFWVAMPLISAVWLVNALVAYWIGRHAARPVLNRFVDQERFDRFERLAERGGVPLLLSMRLVPVVPFSLFSYAAGAARVPLGRFVWTTAVGYLPLTAVFVYLGSRLEALSATDPLLWIGALVLVALVALTARLRRVVFAQRVGS